MGVTVRQKTKGRGQPWWVFVAHNGNRTSRKVGDKAAAQAVASTIRAKLKLGEFSFEDEKPVPTFKEYADSWIKTTVPATCKDSTKHDYEDILRIHVRPVFNNIRITEITRGKVKDFSLDKINQGYAKSTVCHMKNTISGVLNETPRRKRAGSHNGITFIPPHLNPLPPGERELCGNPAASSGVLKKTNKALDNEVISANPALNLGKNFLKEKNKQGAIDPLSNEERKLLLDSVLEHSPEHYAIFLLLARTGLRIGEALALQWSDIDFASRFIDVKRSLVRGRISTHKNGKGRLVDMSLQLAEALKAHDLESKKKGLALGLGDLPEYVFTNENGGWIDKANWRRRLFNKALKKAGLRRIRIHDLRHTYATLRISKRDNIQDVSNQLGHHSTKLTLDVYSHWIPNKKNRKSMAWMIKNSHTHLHPPAPWAV